VLTRSNLPSRVILGYSDVAGDGHPSYPPAVLFKCFLRGIGVHCQSFNQSFRQDFIGVQFPRHGAVRDLSQSNVLLKPDLTGFRTVRDH
jgi:hypothetical protein